MMILKKMEDVNKTNKHMKNICLINKQITDCLTCMSVRLGFKPID